MATSELKPVQDPLQEINCDDDDGDVSEAGGFSDDSDDDPTFDILEETRSKLSRMSLKKPGPRESNDERLESTEIKIQDFNQKDAKCFERIEQLIKDGQLEKLKVDQCKVYLRKFGCRLTGNKEILIARIKEHLEVINGGGETKYPPSSFVLNCKGDACTGDVVIFEQNVYEMYNIASRSATGPPCGTRMVAGRIVKESYGAAKQQHTFTIEVLWSKGEKPLPPLHPLLIKGRNLYRLKTMRQRWTDEEERWKILQEKHARGSLARCSRENRIQEKEMRMMGGTRRVKDNKCDYARPEKENRQNFAPRQLVVSQHQEELPHQIKSNTGVNQNTQAKHPNTELRNAIKSDRPTFREDHSNTIQFIKPHKGEHRADIDVPRALQAKHPNIIYDRPTFPEDHRNTILLIKPQQGEYRSDINVPHSYEHQYEYRHPNLAPHSSSHSRQLSPGRGREYGVRAEHERYRHLSPPPRYFRHGQPSLSSALRYLSPQPQRHLQQRQQCRFYRQGKCYFGDNCKFLHD